MCQVAWVSRVSCMHTFFFPLFPTVPPPVPLWNALWRCWPIDWNFPSSLSAPPHQASSPHQTALAARMHAARGLCHWPASLPITPWLTCANKSDTAGSSWGCAATCWLWLFLCAVSQKGNPILQQSALSILMWVVCSGKPQKPMHVGHFVSTPCAG